MNHHIIITIPVSLKYYIGQKCNSVSIFQILFPCPIIWTKLINLHTHTQLIHLLLNGVMNNAYTYSIDYFHVHEKNDLQYYQIIILLIMYSDEIVSLARTLHLPYHEPNDRSG